MKKIVFKIIYLVFAISLFSCSDPSVINKKGHTFLKVSKNTYLSKFEVSNLNFVEYLNSLSFKKSNTANNSNEVRVGAVPNSSDLRIISFYKGDDYYKAGERIIYKISENESSPIYFDDNKFHILSGKENFPVVRVSWFGAFNYCDYYGFKLPSVEAWVAAADSPTFILKNVSRVKEVSSLIDSTKAGIFNLHSNISEWLEDHLSDGKNSSRQIRGSSFKTILDSNEKNRGKSSPQLLDDVGFRPSFLK